jgi:hypothetical protein
MLRDDYQSGDGETSRRAVGQRVSLDQGPLAVQAITEIESHGVYAVNPFAVSRYRDRPDYFAP